MTTAVVLQSNYIPWKGYFDLIRDADIFVFYDDVQFTKSDWRNRNKIKTPAGAEWMTIPVGGATGHLVCEVELKNAAWQSKHWKTIEQHYRKAPFFKDYRELFEPVYMQRQWATLSDLNHFLIRMIAGEILGIKTVFRDSREFVLPGKKLNRLLSLVEQLGVDCYLSGPAAKDYIDSASFSSAGIELQWKRYEGYPEYPQRFAPFVHGVSIIDLLFNTGPDAAWYIWGWREDAKCSAPVSSLPPRCGI